MINIKRKMKKILNIIFLALMAVSASNVFANTDIGCAAAFNANDGTVKEGNSTICDQDVALNTFTLGLGNAVYNNSAVRSVYNDFGIHLPQQTMGSFVSTVPLNSIAKAVVSVGTLLFLIAFGYRGWVSGVKVMRSGGLEQLARDPQTWKNGGVFALVAALSVHNDGLVVGQLAVVAIFLFSLKLCAFLLSSMISVFSFSATPNPRITQAGVYDGVSDAFAMSVIKGAATTINTAIVNNTMYSSLDAIAHKADADSDDVGNGGFSLFLFIRNWIRGTSDTPVTLDQYISGKFGDTLGLIKYPTYVSQQRMGLNLANISGNSPESVWSAGQSGRGISFWQHSLSIKDIFSTEYVQKMVVRGDMNGDGLVFDKTLVDPVGDSFGDLWMTTHSQVNNSRYINTNAIRIASQVSAISHGASAKDHKYSDADIVNLAQIKALGGYFSKSEHYWDNKYSNGFIFSPFSARAALSSNASFSENPANRIYRSGFIAAEHLRAAECLKNLGAYQSDILAYYNLRKDIGVGGDPTSKLTNTAGDVLDNSPFVGQCLTVLPVGVIDGKRRYIFDLAFGVDDFGTGLTTKGKSVREDLLKLMKERESNPTVDVRSLLTAYSQKLIEDGNNSIIYDEIDAGRKEYQRLSDYFKIISIVGNKVMLQLVQNGSVFQAKQIISGLRKQGVMAIGSYILQISKIQSAFAKVLRFGSVNLSPVNYTNSKSGTLGVNDGKVDFTSPIFSDYKLGTIDESLNMLDGRSTILTVMTNSDIDVKSQADEISDSWSSWLADALIPNDDVLKKGFGFDEHKDLATNLKTCSMTANCVDFKEHPMATLSLFGRDLIATGLMFKGVDAVIQAVDIMITGGGEPSDANGSPKLLGNSIAIRAIFKALMATSGVMGGLIAIFHAISVMSGVASSLATGFITVGIFFGYIIPFLPMLAVLMMGLGWVCEAVLLFLVMPLLLPLVIIHRENGSPLFRVGSIVGMYSSILLRGPLIFISFMVFYTMSYGAIYAANSIAFNMVSHGGEDSFFLIRAFEYLMMFSLVGVLYYASFKTLTDVMVELPDHVMQHIGVTGLRVGVAGSFELAMGAKVLGGVVGDTADNLAGGVTKYPAQKKRDMENQKAGGAKARKAISEKLKQNGYDLNEMLNNGR